MTDWADEVAKAFPLYNKAMRPHLAETLRKIRADGKMEAYAIRLEKHRSGCMCQIGEDDTIVSQCNLHAAIERKTKADGMREACNIIADSNWPQGPETLDTLLLARADAIERGEA